jgi:hypothetical protein
MPRKGMYLDDIVMKISRKTHRPWQVQFTCAHYLLVYMSRVNETPHLS